MATLNHLQLANSVEEALRGEGRPRENHGRGDVPFWARRQREMVNWMLNSFVGLIGARMGVAMMKAVPLVSLLVVLRRTWRLNQIMMRNRRSKVWILIRSAFEMWTLIELIFWIYFRCKKWSLEARRAYQPRVLWKARGERERLLTNFLTTIERIHVGQGYAPLREPKAGVKKKEVGGIYKLRRQSEPAAVGQEARQKLISNPSVENFLRLSDEPNPFGTEVARASQSFMPSTAPSVENLLRSWEVADTTPRTPAEVDVHCLKHLELCSWFSTLTPEGKRDICRDVRQVRRGNIEQWVLSYFFDGAESTSELTDHESVEVQELIDAVATWADLPLPDALKDWAGKNEGLKCFRMRNDPFPAVHRPLLAYVNTAFLAPAIGHQALSFLGFRPFRSGSTEYWFRPPEPEKHWASGLRPRILASGKALVFCHGIGVGPTMCITFLQRLTRSLGQEHPIFLVDTAGISMRFSDDVPGAREVAANIENMLQVWGLERSHFVGHSFGAFVVAWVLRYAPHVVERTTLVDPVCFLVLKILVQGHELQQVRHDNVLDPMEIALKYFVMTELFVCNFVCRCFFWEESNLDMQDLAGIKALIVLESEDLIVPTYSVRSLIFAEQSRRAKVTGLNPSETGLEVHWVEDQPHAGFLLDMVANQDVCDRLQRFHESKP